MQGLYDVLMFRRDCGGIGIQKASILVGFRARVWA